MTYYIFIPCNRYVSLRDWEANSICRKIYRVALAEAETQAHVHKSDCHIESEVVFYTMVVHFYIVLLKPVGTSSLLPLLLLLLYTTCRFNAALVSRILLFVLLAWLVVRPQPYGQPPLFV
jgi:hypothetical protein